MNECIDYYIDITTSSLTESTHITTDLSNLLTDTSSNNNQFTTIYTDESTELSKTTTYLKDGTSTDFLSSHVSTDSPIDGFSKSTDYIYSGTSTPIYSAIFTSTSQIDETSYTRVQPSDHSTSKSTEHSTSTFKTPFTASESNLYTTENYGFVLTTSQDIDEINKRNLTIFVSIFSVLLFIFIVLVGVAYIFHCMKQRRLEKPKKKYFGQLELIQRV